MPVRHTQPHTQPFLLLMTERRSSVFFFFQASPSLPSASLKETIPNQPLNVHNFAHFRGFHHVRLRGQPVMPETYAMRRLPVLESPFFSSFLSSFLSWRIRCLNRLYGGGNLKNQVGLKKPKSEHRKNIKGEEPQKKRTYNYVFFIVIYDYSRENILAFSNPFFLWKRDKDKHNEINFKKNIWLIFFYFNLAHYLINTNPIVYNF